MLLPRVFVPIVRPAPDVYPQLSVPVPQAVVLRPLFQGPSFVSDSQESLAVGFYNRGSKNKTGYSSFLTLNRAPDRQAFFPFRRPILIVGGAQELGLRGGTSNTAGIVGLATAVELIHQQGDTLAKYYEELYKYLRIKLIRRFENAVVINTVPDHKNIVSLNCSGEFYPGDVDSLASMLAAYG